METRKLHKGDVVTGVIQNNRCEFIHEDADQGIRRHHRPRSTQEGHHS